MSVPAEKLSMSVDEYLRAEEVSEVRHEFVDGQIYQMVGSTHAHNVISTNLCALIRSHLRGTSCQVFMADMKLRIDDTNSFYYPDIMVTCEPVNQKDICKKAPVLIIEVLSPSTATIDRREKMFAYKKIASLTEYVIVYQDRQLVEVYHKDLQGQWEMKVVQPPDNLFLGTMPVKPLRVSFQSIYEDAGVP